ncbi:flagellin [Pseudoprimorskyibacter insulae]|nr:flagellin [Pseudoprimorskyibacter insulae]
MRLKTQMNDLSQQVTTGLQTDLASHFSGNLMTIASIEATLNRAEAFKIANTETKAMADSTQAVLETAQTLTDNLTTDFLNADLSTARSARNAIAATAEQTFSALVSQLNTQVGGRSLFAGVATDMSALADPNAIVQAVKSELSGATTLSDVQQRLADWFNAPGGGFATFAYKGADQSRSPSALSDTESVQLDLRADHVVFRNILQATVMGQLAGDPDIAATDELQSAMLSAAGNQLLSVQTRLVELRAELGASQERIENAMARNATEVSALQMTRNALIGADPYEAAGKLNAVQFQLESLYAITARNSRLSLVEYLR